MNVIAVRTLREFWEHHDQAEGPLRDWYNLLRKANFDSFPQLRQTFRSADYAAPYTIFNVGGNKFRVVTVVEYRTQRVYLKRVMTHPEYDRWNARGRQK